MDYQWISTPENISLENKSRWAALSNNRYACVRHLLLVVEQNPVIKNGPLVSQVEWPVNSEYSDQHRQKNVIKYTAGINESITSAITQQLSTEVISKVNAGLAVDKILSATIASELQAKASNQLTVALNQGLAVTKTFETQEEIETTQMLKFTVPKGQHQAETRKISFYNKVKEITWNVYLFQSDYLQLDYKKNLLWKDIRKTIEKETAELKIPLFSITFYEPIPAISYSFDEYQPDVHNITEIHTEKLEDLCPNRVPPKMPTLERLAKLAFPVTKEEKEEVAKLLRRYSISSKERLYRRTALARSAHAKTTSPAKKAAPVKKAVPAKKASPAKKAVPAKRSRPGSKGNTG